MTLLTTEIIHKSFAQVLQTVTPGANVYDNPNQQGTKLPAWFIVHREPVRIEEAPGERCWLTYSIDLVYMLEYNLPRLFDMYSAIGQLLDLNLKTLTFYGTDEKVHVFDRSWETQMDGLRYSCTLRLKVRKDDAEAVLMNEIQECLIRIKHSKVITDTVTLSFENAEYPDASIDIPDARTVERLTMVTLPRVDGIYTQDDATYTPKRWNVGEFGGQWLALDDTIASLVWEKVDDGGDDPDDPVDPDEQDDGRFGGILKAYINLLETSFEVGMTKEADE